MNRILKLIILLSILSSCSENRKINLLFDKTTGLTEKSPVLLNGFKVGDIDKMKLINNQRTFIVIDLTENVEIPKDSKFRIERSGLLGTAVINIEPGKSETPISINDTILGMYSEEPSELEKEVSKALKTFVKLADSLNVESKKEK